MMGLSGGKWIALVLCGCATRANPVEFTQLTAQLAHPVGDTTSDGVAIHAVSGSEAKAFDLGVRRTSDTMEVALGLTLYVESEVLWDRGRVFLRVGVNLLEWDRTNTDDRFGALGPLAEIGLGLKHGYGPCVVASASRDVRFGYRDETFLGLGVGWCSLDPHRARD
jgi:hypothetical protein